MEHLRTLGLQRKYEVYVGIARESDRIIMVCLYHLLPVSFIPLILSHKKRAIKGTNHKV